jgi:hypothetical protein
VGWQLQRAWKTRVAWWFGGEKVNNGGDVHFEWLMLARYRWERESAVAADSNDDFGWMESGERKTADYDLLK